MPGRVAEGDPILTDALGEFGETLTFSVFDGTLTMACTEIQAHPGRGLGLAPETLFAAPLRFDGAPDSLYIELTLPAGG